jgi:Flp pilus assembly protein TadD
MFGKYHLALARAAVGDQEGAEEAFAAAAKLSNFRTPRMAQAEAATLEALGRTADARQVLRDALDRNRGDESLTLALAQVGTSAAAPIVRSPQDGIAEVMVGLADGLSQGRNTDLALIYARFGAFLRPDLDEAKLLIADLMNDEEQYDIAIATYDEIAPDSPFYIPAQIGRADSLDRMEKSDAAYDVLRKLATENPKSLRAQKALGDQLRGSERFIEAAAAYSAAIDLLGPLEPNDWLLFYQRGISYERGGQWTRGEKDLRQALELAPDQPLVLNYLGYSMVEQHASLEEAQKLIEKAVAKRPDDGYITDSLGWVLYRLGKYDEAVTKMEQAVELTPVDPIINDHLGDVLWKVGRKMEARFQWRRALSFDPTPEDAQRIREKLERGLDAVLEDEAKKAASTTPPATGTNGG